MLICVADAHIRPGCPEDSEKFIHWLELAEQKASDVYILGDLFDYWFTGIQKKVGDVIKALVSPHVHIIPGNRDFLIVQAGELGLHILGEEEIITSPSSTRLLLAHGHTLTRDDYGFKALHALGWPLLMFLDRHLHQSFKERLARFLVRSSSTIRTPRAVIDSGTCRRRGVDTVICGHLHRGFVSRELIVLPAFFDTGQWLVWDGNGPRIAGGQQHPLEI